LIGDHFSAGVEPWVFEPFETSSSTHPLAVQPVQCAVQMQHAFCDWCSLEESELADPMHMNHQPEEGCLLGQGSLAANSKDAPASFVWEYWNKLGNHKNTNRHSAICKYCKHRVEDGRIPRLVDHTLECTRVPKDIKRDVRLNVDVQSRTASVSEVTGHWVFLAETLQQELQNCLQPKGEKP